MTRITAHLFYARPQEPQLQRLVVHFEQVLDSSLAARLLHHLQLILRFCPRRRKFCSAGDSIAIGTATDRRLLRVVDFVIIVLYISFVLPLSSPHSRLYGPIQNV